MTTATAPRTRMTADERREQVIAAAVHEFAEQGYAGTSTEDIARRAGISQPYLFRLFGTKKQLFLAAVERCFQETLAGFRAASPPGTAGQLADPATGSGRQHSRYNRSRSSPRPSGLATAGGGPASAPMGTASAPRTSSPAPGAQPPLPTASPSDLTVPTPADFRRPPPSPLTDVPPSSLSRELTGAERSRG